MKKPFKIILLILFIIICGAFLYWQFIKKGVVRNALEKAVVTQTDSTYYIHYESSNIDEINGNATFNNIVLQSDSLQEKLYLNDTAIAATIFNVHIQQLNIRGADIPSFLQKNTIEANSIEIIRPVITIIKMGKDDKIELTAEDSLALYDRITGKFKSIQAKEIKIVDAKIAFAKGKNSPHTTLEDVSVTLKNLKIDSTRNYDNIISYFVKDVVATVKSVNIQDFDSKRILVFDNLQYNAPGRFVSIGRAFQKDNANGRLLMELKNNTVRGISTNDFILNRKIMADSLTSDGGVVALTRNKKQKAAKQELEIDNNFFDEVLVKNIRLGNTNVYLYDHATPSAGPLMLKNLKFNASAVDNIYDGTNLKKLIAGSNWDLTGDGVSFTTKDNLNKIVIAGFAINKQRSTVQINSLSIIPLLTESAFKKSLKKQKDRFEAKFSNIVMTGANVQDLLDNGNVVAEKVELQPSIKIFNDRTITPDTESKVGKYPHQQLVKLNVPVNIKKLVIKNGYLSYRERGAVSKQVGDVFFSNINGTVTNVTNLPASISANNIMQLTASTKFLGVANINTTWKLPLNSTNGSFTATGSLAAFDATKLSAITEPLGNASIKSGRVDALDFLINGTDLNSTGKVTMLYHDLKISLLKGGADSSQDLKKRGLLSFVANIFTKDKNPSGGVTRATKINFTRDVNKSFFNLLWKSIFDGAKRTAMGKNDY